MVDPAELSRAIQEAIKDMQVSRATDPGLPLVDGGDMLWMAGVTLTGYAATLDNPAAAAALVACGHALRRASLVQLVLPKRVGQYAGMVRQPKP